MKQPGRFLTAEWNNLLIFNYAVDRALLEPFVPPGTELDSFRGRNYVSLIGFEFNNTRVLRVAVPFHRSFEEVNLRFYVKRKSRRGVVFIRELVPRYAVALIARTIFGENYRSVPMSHSVQPSADGDAIHAEYSWGSGANRCSMRIETGSPQFLPADGSLGQFITEHYWGYAAQKDGGCLEYEVQHPRWSIRKGTTAEFQGNTERCYGEEFAKVLAQPPESAFLVDGSPVIVFKGTKIR
jgi:uncharacterized protein YqjF (DUF2071 family)